MKLCMRLTLTIEKNSKLVMKKGFYLKRILKYESND
jgi:hypothetical protein